MKMRRDRGFSSHTSEDDEKEDASHPGSVLCLHLQSLKVRYQAIRSAAGRQIRF
jgi:hypothetical protein